jgi:hypothetical protein
MTGAQILYVDPPDIPEGMTIEEFRRTRRRGQARRPRRSLWSLRRGRSEAASRSEPPGR